MRTLLTLPGQRLLYSAARDQLRHRRAGQASRGPSSLDGSGPLRRRRQRAGAGLRGVRALAARPRRRGGDRCSAGAEGGRRARRVHGARSRRRWRRNDSDADRRARRRHPEPRRLAVRGAAVVSPRDGSGASRRRARRDRRRDDAGGRAGRRRRRGGGLRGAAARRRRRRRPRRGRAAPARRRRAQPLLRLGMRGRRRPPRAPSTPPPTSRA